MSTSRPSVVRAAAFVGAALVADLGMWAWARAGRTNVDSAFVAYGILLVALALTSGAVAEFGLLRRREVAAISPVTTRRRPWPVIAVLTAAVALMILGFLLATTTTDYPRSVGSDVRGSIIVLTTIVLAWPAATALHRVRVAALELEVADLGLAVEHLRRLRDISRRLLEALGSLVSLTTLALGASWLSHTSGTSASPAVLEIIVFGASGTAVVGSLYLLPYSALQDRARALAQQILPLAGAPSEDLASRVAERDTLERGLGLSSGIVDELMSRIIVAGPVLAAAVTLMISR